MDHVIQWLTEQQEFLWINPDLTPFSQADFGYPLTFSQIEDASERLERFAPLLKKLFPQLKTGIIESPLQPIPHMQKAFGGVNGTVLLKRDDSLPVAGSVKARGGIYEVLKHTEELAVKNGLITENSNYSILADRKDFFSKYTIQVGSTGNLGLSIGIMSAALGYNAVVHMSADARQWKKDLLRSHGVEVIEYNDDYSAAVKEGRKLSDQNPNSYFVDDENSVDLFFGYAVAALRTKKQLEDMQIPVDADHPLNIYIPCGVGGAPGGITFGFKQLFGDHVHCYFVEPTAAPCMLLGMVTEKGSDICVQDIGLSGLTHADGLAVGRPSGFVGRVMKNILSGIVTVRDQSLYYYMRLLEETEGIFIEPSACAAFEGMKYADEDATHILWATGGSMVPEEIRAQYRETYL